jgi:hypothetical protein
MTYLLRASLGFWSDAAGLIEKPRLDSELISPAKIKGANWSRPN